MPRTKNQPLLSALDRRRFLTAVQYEIFYTGLKICDLDEYALLQRLAESACPDTLEKALRELTLNETVELVYYAFRNYREGSYAILTTLETIYPLDHPLQTLIDGFRSYYYDLNQRLPLELSQLLAFQEVYARKQTELCFNLFCRLIPLIVASPLHIAQVTEGDLGQAAERKRALEQRFRYVPSLSEFQNFTRRFGLHNQVPFLWKGTKQPETSLHDKLQLLCKLFERPEALPQIAAGEMVAFLSYALNILMHLEAMRQQPNKYTAGLQMLTCAIPTRNKNLAALPGVASLLRGLKDVLPSLGAFPIFIYDQSEPEIYAINQHYLAQLARRYECPILHLHLAQILMLGKKIGAERLLDTTQKGQLGFGGARNCVFLLTPVLRQLFVRGYQTVQAMLASDPALLKQLFQAHVLAHKELAGNAIFMIDDDMEIPPSNLFCHAFFAHEAFNRYSCSASYAIGRATKFNIIYPAFRQVLTDPKAIFSSSQWTTDICSAAMSEYVTKPKICLNLPFGSEEQHLRGLMEANPLLHPSIHLAGPRYPTGAVPTRPWYGLEEYLTWYLPYSIQIAMTVSLLDPTGKQGRCVFPWNQKEQLQTHTSLRSAFHHITSQDQRKEMQKRFWRNVELFRQSEVEDMPFLTAIKDLIDCDIAQVIQECQIQAWLTSDEKNSLEKIGAIYAFYQQDARLLWRFVEIAISGTAVDEAKSILESERSLSFSQFPLTNGLHLLFHSVGLAEFNQLLADLETP